MAVNAVDPLGKRRQHARNLLRWLLLAPLVLLTLLCCGQLGLILRPPARPADTHSKLQADYKSWEFQRISRVNATAMIADMVRNDEEPVALMQSTLAQGAFWPTSPNHTPAPIRLDPTATQTPQPTDLPPTASNTPLPPPTLTNTQPPSLTPTSPPTSTVTPRPLPTRTRTTISSATSPVDPEPDTPTITSTPSLVPSATSTITPQNSVTPTPTGTHTIMPSYTPTETLTPTITDLPTNTPIPSNTPVPSPTPTFSRLHPIIENGGVTEQAGPGRCRAYFGYLNDNPFILTIPAGSSSNQLSQPVDLISPELPSTFLTGRVLNNFYIEWTGGAPVSWLLDGRSATAAWCNPTP